MSMLRPLAGHYRIHTLHRLSVGAAGVFLMVFGVLGLSRHLDFLSTSGAVVMGLSTNGALATLSVVVAVALLGAAWRSGPTASAVGVVVGGLFVLSGVVNLFLLGSAMNMLAFHLSNVVFSLAVGLALLLIGAYGRLTGHLPPDSPYAHPETPHPVGGPPRTAAERAADRRADEDLAEAERAVARHHATPRQRDGVARAAGARGAEGRRTAWRAGEDRAEG